MKIKDTNLSNLTALSPELIANLENLLDNQKVLAEELLVEKKEKLSQLQKELVEKKQNCLDTFKSKQNASSSPSYCNNCGQYHCSKQNKVIDYQAHLEIALECKSYMLKGECSELASKLFTKCYNKLKEVNGTDAVNLFDLFEKVDQQKQSIQTLEKSIEDVQLQKEELSQKQEEAIITPTTEVTEVIEAESYFVNRIIGS